jgi:hypothetical protein
MIVIATNNGYAERQSRGDEITRSRFLENLLISIEKLNYEGDVVVKDTGSNDLDSINYLENLKKENPFNFNLIVDSSTHPFSTGAYLCAFRKYISDYYIFIQDSMEIKDIDFIKDVEGLLTDNNVVCLVKGDRKLYDYDNNEQREYVYSSIGHTEYDYLIFGPVFFIKRSVFEKVIDSINLLPRKKSEDSGMERAFGSLFKLNNIDIVAIDGEYDFNKMVYDKLRYIKKYHINRQ